MLKGVRVVSENGATKVFDAETGGEIEGVTSVRFSHDNYNLPRLELEISCINRDVVVVVDMPDKK